MDVKKIEKAVSLFLEGLGEDPRREGLVKTPQRVAEMCREIFGGLATTPELQPAFSEKLGEDDAIEVRGIRFYSVCEHHLLPFFGKIDILYVPGNNRVAGFSDLLALVDGFARRPQIQERLTAQIADAVFQQLSPRAVVVVARATHLCMAMRGAHKREAQAVTRAVRGEHYLARISNFK